MDPYTLPIPDMTRQRAVRRHARAHPIDLSAPENRECAVDVREAGIAGDNYYHLEQGNPPYHHRAPGSIPELYVREGVLARLLAANSILAFRGYALYLFDAYRPVEVQNYFHDEWVPAYLHKHNPRWSEAEIEEETGRYWAKGAPHHQVDPLSPPPHATGAVVDCTLIELETRTLLHMGSPFDAVEVHSYVDHFEQLALARPLLPLEETALMHRRLLYGVMREVGFTVNPNEWWHFGVGDQLSAILAGQPYAVYSHMDVV